MKNLNPQGLIKNYILSTFLKNYKTIEPYVFWKNSKYYGQFEPELKSVLESPDTLVIIKTEDGCVTPYQGPFTLQTDKKVNGWIIGNTKEHSIYSFYVNYSSRNCGYAREMIGLMFIHLHQPNKVKLVYPTRILFNTLRQVLGGRAIIFVDNEKN